MSDVIVEPNPLAAQESHFQCLARMQSRAFAAYKALCDDVIGPGKLYFRATGNGVVQIALTDDAPGYVGFRTSRTDQGHLLKPRGKLPDRAQLEERWQRFREWLPTVRRTSKEEQAVIPWLRHALTHELYLEAMGDGWVLLNQEWRFLDAAGKGKKSDVLAVHLPSERLGIVEFKDARSKRGDAVRQVADYRDFWMRDGEMLAGFFSEQLRVMGALFGNGDAAEGRVKAGAPVLFFGFPDGGGVCVERVKCGG